MQSDRDLLKQALEALQAVYWSARSEAHDTIITALRERLERPEFDDALQSAAMTQTATKLAQPEQEPVAHLWQHSETGRTRIVMPDQIITADATWHVVGPLYLGAPPRREWVGLTDEDIYGEGRNHEKFARDGSEWFDRGSFARAIEAKLREKNA